MILKDNNVLTTGMKPELMIAVLAAYHVFNDEGYECVITSMNDGKHSERSLHYSGCAFDVRTKHLPSKVVAEKITNRIQRSLNRDYDVILEENHIHIEFQPERRYV